MKVSPKIPSAKQQYTVSRIRTRFTKSGLLFFIVTMLIMTAAIRGRAAMMLVIFSMMFIALMLSVLISRRNVAKVRLRRDIPPRVWQNELVMLGYYLRNTHKRGNALAMTLTERAPKGIHSISGYCLSLPALRNFRAQASLKPKRRGKIMLKRIELSTVFPFGLVRAWKVVRQNSQLIVWPARGRLKSQLLFRGAIETSQAAPSQAAGGQDEFFGLREYRPGDNPRWIHWKSSALRTTPVIREMSKPLPEQVWVVIDTFLSDLSELGFYNREKMMRFAVTVIDYAFRHGYEVGVVVGDNDGANVIPAFAGKSHRTACMDAIASVAKNTKCPIETVLGNINRNTFRHAQLIVTAPQDDNLKPDTLNLLKSRSRHLTVVTPSNIDGLFEDAKDLLEIS